MMSDPILRKNIFLTDENVNGPAIDLARVRGVQIIRDIDLNIPCGIDDYDQCLFDFAVEHNYIVVPANIKHFEPKFYKFAESGDDHPGSVLIRPEHITSSILIAEWLELWADEPFTNRMQRLPPD